MRTYPWSQAYTTCDYLRLLNTYSDHRRLEAPRRERLFGEIAELIKHGYGGSVTKDYLAVLYVLKSAHQPETFLELNL